MQPNQITEILNRPISQELLARDSHAPGPTSPRMAHRAISRSGSPGTARKSSMRTLKKAPVVLVPAPEPCRSRRADLQDPEAYLPQDLAHPRSGRGGNVVDGIPNEHLQTNGTYIITPWKQRVHWEAEVRSLYDGMVRIVVTPTWAKLIDFELTLPGAVEELIKATGRSPASLRFLKPARNRRGRMSRNRPRPPSQERMQPPWTLLYSLKGELLSD